MGNGDVCSPRGFGRQCVQSKKLLDMLLDDFIVWSEEVAESGSDRFGIRSEVNVVI